MDVEWFGGDVVDWFYYCWVEGDVGYEMFVYYVDMDLVGVCYIDCVYFFVKFWEVCG